MKKIENKKINYAFVHKMNETLVRFTPRTVEHEHDKTFDNLLYMSIQDEDNDITMLFESIEEIDKLIDQLKQVKTRMGIDEIELGTGNKEVE